MTWVVLLVLLAAISHAGWHAFIKASDDRVAGLVAINLVSTTVGLVMVFFVPLLDARGWQILAVSVVVHLLYKLLLPVAYRVGDLAHMYPIVRGVAPLLVAGITVSFAGEKMHAAESVGMALICAGIMTLTLEQRQDRWISLRPLLIAMLTGAVIAVYTVVDGYGARRPTGPFAFAAWLFVFDGATFILAAWMRRGQLLWSSVRQRWRSGAGAGVIAVASYGTFVWALAMGAMGTIAALRETSVVFAALLGSLFLGERMSWVRLVAIATITAGIVLIARHHG